MRWVVIMSCLSLSGCAVVAGEEELPEGDFHGEVDSEEPFYDELADSAGLVREQRINCTTRGVLGLSAQIVAEMQCIAPDGLETLDSDANVEFTGGAVLPFFSPEAIFDIEAAANQTEPLQINSGFRTVVQQHLIYGWYEDGRCGVSIAAKPGRSRHESGRALDIRNHANVSRAMEIHDWDQPVPGDHIHFEHADSPDLRGVGVIAFQRLWNRNHPEDPIAISGTYDDATRDRIDDAPADGFQRGAQCAAGGLRDPQLEVDKEPKARWRR